MTTMECLHLDVSNGTRFSRADCFVVQYLALVDYSTNSIEQSRSVDAPTETDPGVSCIHLVPHFRFEFEEVLAWQVKGNAFMLSLES